MQSPPLHRHAIAAFAVMMLAMSVVWSHQASAGQAVVLDIDGAIGPAVADYVVRELRAAKPDEVGLIVVRMNTPGGLDSSMREINGAILASPVPVATYVAPSGARAASAGTYIAYASAIAAMAPGTNLGAATPIQLRGPSFFPGTRPEQPAGHGNDQDKDKTAEPTDAESRKAVNDAAAYIRGLADLNGRNADWAVDAVRTAASLSAPEALRLHVIDVIADDIPDLLRKIDGRTVRLAGRSETLNTAGLQVVAVAPGWRTELLAVITNPNVALILMMIGVYGLIFEFLNPGAVAPGLIGGLSLLVALYALNLLPINYAGLALVLLGIGLMIAEVHIGTFGVIGIGGIVAFVIGAIMMFPAEGPGLGLSMPVVVIIAATTLGFFLLVLTMLLRSRRRAVVSGAEALRGAAGEAVSWQGTEGRVRISGEIWRARGIGPLQPGDRVKVVARDGLVVVVEPAYKSPLINANSD
jgi:membrane-bound serine protease (ClpP class)